MCFPTPRLNKVAPTLTDCINQRSIVFNSNVSLEELSFFNIAVSQGIFKSNYHGVAYQKCP